MLAKELAPHRITVNAICPGSTDTDMMDGTFGRTEDRMGLPQGSIKQIVQSFIPIGRQAEPSEMAGIIAYLASDAGSYITGQSILVDGGILMR
jgi:NAD(P)-dependent dehydrogenase (short-subunit alcohol dehydrogenase family)